MSKEERSPTSIGRELQQDLDKQKELIAALLVATDKIEKVPQRIEDSERTTHRNDIRNRAKALQEEEK